MNTRMRTHNYPHDKNKFELYMRSLSSRCILLIVSTHVHIRIYNKERFLATKVIELFDVIDGLVLQTLLLVRFFRRY